MGHHHHLRAQGKDVIVVAEAKAAQQRLAALGGLRIEGPRLDPTFTPSFVGLYNIPYVYGLTPGELARWINANYLAKPCKLSIVAMRG